MAGKLAGLVVIFSKSTLPADAREALLQVADLVALGIERLRGEAARQELLAREHAAREEAEDLARILVENEARLTRVMIAAGVGLWDLEVASGHIEADGRLMELMGLPTFGQLTLATFLEAVHAQDRERVESAIAAALAGKDAGRFVIEFRTIGDGEAPVRWVESRAQVLFDAEGRARSMAAAMTDVMERKRAADERQAALKRQVEFEQQLIGIVSHDLRNPLNAILFSAALLSRGGNLDSAAARNVERVERAASAPPAWSAICSTSRRRASAAGFASGRSRWS